MAKRDTTQELPDQLMEMNPEIETVIETITKDESWALRWFEISSLTVWTVVLDSGQDTLIIEYPGFRLINKDGFTTYVTPAIYEMAQAIREKAIIEYIEGHP